MGKIIRKKIENIKSCLHWAKILWHPTQRCAYFLGTPTHTNIGDSAIVVAEKKYLLQHGYERVIEITVREYESNRKAISRLMPVSANIFLPGGGNMGSLWPIEEEWRSHIIDDFSGHNTVIFPQTVYYSDDADAKMLKASSVNMYNTKPKLTVVAREKQSFELLKEIYPNLNVLLAPDIVLSMGQQNFNITRAGILICFRKDKERSLNIDDEKVFIRSLKEKGHSVRQSDTMSSEQITVENREKILENKLKEFAGAGLIVTDRLHGMVFAAITATPCIVLGNNHHKVIGTYEWIKKLDYIRFASTIDEAECMVDDLLNMRDCVFEFDETLYSDLSNHLINMK